MQTEAVELFTEIRAALTWAPDWAVGAILLALAIVAALAIHGGVLVLLRRLISKEHKFLRSLIESTREPTRLALVIFALGAAVQAARLAPEITTALTQALAVALVILFGWIAAIAVKIAGKLYLRRFALESEDNLLARKHITQVRILERAALTLVLVVTVAAMLMTFDAVRQYGISLFASAGVAGIIVGLAARPVLSNLIAGLQIAVTQPIRIDDRVVVEGENGTIEEITSTYVVVKLWDLRRMIVPLSHFIEKPFENWTMESSDLTGAVYLHADYTAPMDRLREKLAEIVAQSKFWDGKTAKLQVTDAREQSLELRILVSAKSATAAFELRCEVREKMIEFLRTELPHVLPRTRQEVVPGERAEEKGAAAPAERQQKSA